MATIWQKPEFTEISMNAEIGSYQEDFDTWENPPLVEDVKEATTSPPGEAGS